MNKLSIYYEYIMNSTQSIVIINKFLFQLLCFNYQ